MAEVAGLCDGTVLVLVDFDEDAGTGRYRMRPKRPKRVVGSAVGDAP